MIKFHLIPIFLISVFTYGQTNNTTSLASEKKVWYEFSLNLYSLTDTQHNIFDIGPGMNDGTNSNIKNYRGDFHSHYLPGFLIKRGCNNNLFRFSFDRTKNSYYEHQTDHSYWSNSLTGELQVVEFKLGYERDFGIKKIKPFISSDLVFRNSTFSGIFSQVSYLPQYETSDFTILTRHDYSINIGSGLKYKISKNLCVTYELGLMLGFYNNMGHSHIDRYFMHLNPVKQLGISYMINKR